MTDLNSEADDMREHLGSDLPKESSPADSIKKEDMNEEETPTIEEPEAQAPKKRKKASSTKKPSAEVLQRRKEGRLKAAATIANNLKKTGIGRFEAANGFKLTSVNQIPLINQKNYYTDYLKKDEQISFVRNRRAERLIAQKISNMKKSDSKKEPDNDKSQEAKNFDNFNLSEIEAEMKKNKGDSVAPDEEEEEEEEEEDNENEQDEVSEQKSKLGFDTIVIHPGSSTLRIGRATDAFPKAVPTVIAVPNTNHEWDDKITPEREVGENGEISFGEEFDEAKEVVTKDFKARMRFYKRRILPNSRETAANYNRRQMPEDIPDHNDPMRKDWVDVKAPEYSNRKFFVGEDAINLPICERFKDWKLRYPIVNGKFNEDSDSYNSPQELLGDLTNIVADSLESLDIKKSQLGQMKVILIIPDLYDKVYVETWCDLLFRLVGFGRIGIIQESVSATFGAGATTACVVDVGAQTTTISCVDEGMVVNDSRIMLNFGGDNVTETFIKLLLESYFPYRDINLNSNNDDWQLAQQLKHDYVTFQDADIAIQLYHFYKRKPFEMTVKYEFKVFDEVMLAPLGLYFPEIFQIKSQPIKSNLFSPSIDQYSGRPNNPCSRAQENLKNNLLLTDLTDDILLTRLLEARGENRGTNPSSKPLPAKMSSKNDATSTICMPLEKAIIESITSAGIATDFEKTKKYYDNLLIVGGGLAKISGFDLLLTDRINIWRPKVLSSNTLDDILQIAAKEKARVDQKRQEMIDELKAKKQENDEPLEEIELTEEEIAGIESKTQPSYDLDHINTLSDQGSLLPVNVLPPPREFDPEVLTWKGGSVYGRLKVVSEMWITQSEWDLLKGRCLYYKTLFNY